MTLEGEFLVVELDMQSFAVVWRPDCHKDWLHILGAFSSRPRAEAYADLERTCQTAGMITAPEEVKQAPPAGAAEPVGLTPGEANQRAILRALSARKDERGLVQLSISEIASASGVPKGSIRATIDVLLDRNELVLARPGRPGKHGCSSTYQVLETA